MKKENNIVFNKNKFTPKNVKINNNEYFIAKKIEDIINPKCNKISISMIEKMKQINNFEFEITISKKQINENDFHIEKLLGIKNIKERIGDNIKIKTIIYPNQRTDDFVFCISNKLFFPNNENVFLYSIVNYDNFGELIYLSSISPMSEHSYISTVLPTNIIFHQSSIDDYYWDYIKPSYEDIIEFILENNINPFKFNKNEFDLFLLNFQFK
jgi:hypothetical protein